MSNNISPLKDRCDEADIPTEQQKKKERSRISGAHEHQRRAESHQEAATERPEAPRCLMIERYGPQERIRKKKDFSDLYKKGSCARGKYFNLIFLPNGLGHSRMAAVTSKKVGNAVERNRIRRRARDLYRRNKDLLAYPVDILLIAKKDIKDATWQDLLLRYRSAVEAIKDRP